MYILHIKKNQVLLPQDHASSHTSSLRFFFLFSFFPPSFFPLYSCSHPTHTYATLFFSRCIYTYTHLVSFSNVSRGMTSRSSSELLSSSLPRPPPPPPGACEGGGSAAGTSIAPPADTETGAAPVHTESVCARERQRERKKKREKERESARERERERERELERRGGRSRTGRRSRSLGLTVSRSLRVTVSGYELIPVQSMQASVASGRSCSSSRSTSVGL